MAGFVIAMILFVVAIVAVIVAVADREWRVGGALVALVLDLIGGGILIGVSHVSVEANTVGIIQEFGKPVGDPVGPGWTWTAPWATVDKIPTQVQSTARLAGDKGDVPGADCVKVNFKDNASACVDITISYRVSDQNAVKLWKNYTSLDDARDRLLRPITDNAVREAYGSETSLDTLNGSTLSDIAKKITDLMQSKLSNSGLDLVSVAPGQIHLSDTAQANLDKLRDAQVEIQVAQAALAKNQALAAANAALNASLTDGIRFEDCLKVAAEIKTVGFSCTGSGSGVLLNVGGK